MQGDAAEVSASADALKAALHAHLWDDQAGVFVAYNTSSKALFYLSAPFCAMGQKVDFLCLIGIVVIKFTKSRKLPRHPFKFYC